MRVDRHLLLGVIVAVGVATPARGDVGRQNPDGSWVCGSNPRGCEPVNPPSVPEPSCQCGPNGEWVKCSQCGAPRTTQPPPTPKGLIALFRLAGTTIGFAVAPAHLVGAFTRTQSAREARAAWDDERARITALEAADTKAVVLRGSIERARELAATKPAARLAQQQLSYTPVGSPPPPDAWSSRGACTQLLAAHDAGLEQMRARAVARARTQLPTIQGLVKRAKQESLDLVARKLGAQKLLAHGQALQRDYKRAKEMEAFLKELTECAEKKKGGLDQACEMKILERVNAELRPLLDEFQAGAGDAHARVREAAAFYRTYVNDLERQIERHAALSVARCR